MCADDVDLVPAVCQSIIYNKTDVLLSLLSCDTISLSYKKLEHEPILILQMQRKSSCHKCEKILFNSYKFLLKIQYFTFILPDEHHMGFKF